MDSTNPDADQGEDEGHTNIVQIIAIVLLASGVVFMAVGGAYYLNRWGDVPSRKAVADIGDAVLVETADLKEMDDIETGTNNIDQKGNDDDESEVEDSQLADEASRIKTDEEAEELRQKSAKEEAEREAVEEAARLKALEDARLADEARIQAEEEASRIANEEAAAEEAARLKALEDERLADEARILAEEEASRIAKEEAEREKAEAEAAEEAARLNAIEDERLADEARIRAEEEAEEERQKAVAEEAARLKAIEDERLADEARIMAEEEAHKHAIEEADRLKAVEDARLAEEAQTRAEEEAARIAKEEEEARIAEDEEEQARIAKEEEEARIAEEEAAARIAKEEEEARIAKEEEEQARIAKEEEEQARIAKEEDEARIAEEEAAIENARLAEEARIIAEEEAARIAKEEAERKKADEEAATEVARLAEIARISAAETALNEIQKKKDQQQHEAHSTPAQSDDATPRQSHPAVSSEGNTVVAPQEVPLENLVTTSDKTPPTNVPDVVVPSPVKIDGSAPQEMHIDIIAPAGKLGVILDTPGGGPLIVQEIRPNSVLKDKLQLGDKVIALDDESVQLMTPKEVSNLIGSKKDNPTRKFSIARTMTGKPGSDVAVPQEELSNVPGDVNNDAQAPQEESIEVYAPPGKLGIVLQPNPDGPLTVQEVRPFSVLRDKLQLGDKVIALDDEDVQMMTPNDVARIISRKKDNPTRKFSILRSIRSKQATGNVEIRTSVAPTTGNQQQQQIQSTPSQSGNAASKLPPASVKSARRKEELIEIYAPAGKLGVVLDTPGDSLIVHEIRPTSVLKNQLQVGDKVIALDDEDVRKMSPNQVSKIISSKKDNPTRKFSIMRATNK